MRLLSIVVGLGRGWLELSPTGSMA